MTPFHYTRISRAFIETLIDKVSSGESAVLLGPRYGGKRYVITRLHDRLRALGEAPVVEVKLLGQAPVTTEREAIDLISQAVTRANGNLRLEQPANDLFAAIDQLSAQTGKPVTLLTANVDGMPHHLSRRFLEGVRTRVESRQLIVVLSGEADLRDLVHGPSSEFNCANQFVFQGFAEDEFSTLIYQYTGPLNLEFEPSKEVCHHLWDLTGGNIYLLRLVLWAVVESRARSKDFQSAPVKVSDVATSLNMMRVPGAYGGHILRHSTQLIARVPECWDDLQNLIEGKSVTIGLTESAPGPLELAGVVIREGAQLRFASRLMEDFVRQHYTPRRFGDLYARINQWEKAFECYSQLDSEKMIRPLDVDDRSDVEFTIRALSAALHSAAAKGVRDVKKLFDQGCRYVLGFPQITFWQHSKEWQRQLLDGFLVSEKVKHEALNILPSGGLVSPGLLPVPEPWNRFAVAAILPALRPNQQDAVVVGDFEKKTVISLERERLVKDLLRHFVEAYSHAVSVERDRVRLWVRDQHVEIVNSIFEALGSRVLDVGHVLAMAARGLRDLGYRRVLFCLVDPEGKRIQGVLDDSYNPSVNVAEMTDWPLDDPTVDLQPYVIRTGQSKPVEDATQEPLANPKVVQAAKMKALAIVSILNHADDAIGTIHVERLDGAVPSKEEIDDLVAFGRQLAVAIEQSERVNLLQTALDKIPEPVVIVDRLEQARYANKPGSELLGIQPGWRDRSDAQPLRGGGTGEILQYLHGSLTLRRRIVHHVKGIGSEPDYRGAVLSDNIQDWRDRTVGALLHIQDLNYLHRIFEVFRLAAGAHDTISAMETMLLAARLLGCKWGRLYLIDKEDPDCLVGRLSFGFADPQKQAEFNAGNVRLRPHSQGSNSWWCIDRKVPLVFCWRPNLEEGQTLVTTHGLVAINEKDPECVDELEKKPGDFWIDFPLITQERPLGKLTLQCDESLRPEEFELLNVLSEMTAGLLDGFLQQDRQLDEREQHIRVSAEEKTLATMAHNIATRLTGLPILLARYRAHEKTFGSLKALNNGFAYILDETLNTVKRAKEFFAPVARPSQFDLEACIKRALSAARPGEVWTVKSSESPLQVQADEHLLASALLEIVQNSRDMAANDEPMRASITIECKQHDFQEWVRIVYRDNGPGVPADLKRRIFEDFFSYRPGRTTGTGLGLGFVRRVVEAHSGTIREQGQPGQGAEFVIEIPRGIPVETEESPENRTVHPIV